MKRIAYIFTLACLIILSACSGSDNTGGGGGGGGGGKTYTVNITSGSSSTVAAAGGTVTVSFTTNDTWTASSAGSWCSLSASSGASGSNSITVEVAPNSSYDERNTSVTITCGTKSAKATITQKQLDAILVSSDKLEVDYNGGAAEIGVQSNIEYTYQITEGGEWIKEGTPTKGLKSSTIYLDIDENWEENVRQGKITVTGNGITETVNVYQQASTPRIVISDPEIIVESEEQEISVELKSNCDYTIDMPKVDWIERLDTKAVSVYTLTFKVKENKTYDSRSAEIKITNLETTEVETISVYQSQKNAIIIAKSEYEVGYSEDTLNFNVSTNVDFDTQIDVDWITSTPASKGLTEKTLIFKVATNNTAEARTGHITLSYDKIEQVVTVIQEGNENVSIAKVTHSEKKFTIPEIGNIISGTIDWGDGNSEDYSVNAKHQYADESEKTVIIQWLGGDFVKIEKLQSISEIEGQYTVE